MSQQSKTMNMTGNVPALLKSAVASLVVLAPSLISIIFLIQHRIPLNAPYLTACLVLALAAVDFGAVIMIEPHRRKLSKLTLPAFVCSMAVVLLFVLMETVNRFFEHFGYDWLTPFVIAGISLIYATIFLERNVLLKALLSLNSVAIAFLWAMGSIDKITMPF